LQSLTLISRRCTATSRSLLATTRGSAPSRDGLLRCPQARTSGSVFGSGSRLSFPTLGTGLCLSFPTLGVGLCLSFPPLGKGLCLWVFGTQSLSHRTALVHLSFTILDLCLTEQHWLNFLSQFLNFVLPNSTGSTFFHNPWSLSHRTALAHLSFTILDLCLTEQHSLNPLSQLLISVSPNSTVSSPFHNS